MQTSCPIAIWSMISNDSHSLHCKKRVSRIPMEEGWSARRYWPLVLCSLLSTWVAFWFLPKALLVNISECIQSEYGIKEKGARYDFLLRHFSHQRLVIKNSANYLYPIVSYRILLYPIVSYHIVSYPIVSCRILLYPIVWYRILSYPVVSYDL